MRVDGEQMWTLLRSLDDPHNLEFPAGYDHSATRRQFDELVGQLDAKFSCRCTADRHVEDASLHARVDVPSQATDTGETLVICISNFGGLATVAITNPGAWSQSEFEALLAPRDADRIYGVLDDLGYTAVPEEPLWNDYDGPSAIADLEARNGATWWTRFFDYL